MKKENTRGTTPAQDKNIIKLIKKSARLFWVDRGHSISFIKSPNSPILVPSIYVDTSIKSPNSPILVPSIYVDTSNRIKPSTIQQAADPRACNYLFIFISKEKRNNPAALYLVKWENNRAKPCKWTKRNSRDLLAFNQYCWTCQDAENLRKDGDSFFLLKVAPQYNEQDQEKQEQRRNNRPNPTTAQRIGTAKPCTEEEHTQRGERYESRRDTWGSVRRVVLDASGYNLTESRARLHRRARELEKARKLEQWNNTDHAETVQELRTYAGELLRAAVAVFLSSADFYSQNMAQDLRKSADYIETTADQIENKTAENAENIAHRVEHSRELLKKCRILRPLAADPRAYGWNWWELTAAGELVNTYSENKTSRKYYDRITAESVGIMEEQTGGAQ